MNFLQELDLEKDLPMMDYYVQTYGAFSAMPMAEYLNEWYSAKSRYLLPIFQNQLIHKKTIHYSRNTEVIEYDLNRLLFSTVTWSDMSVDILTMLRYVLFDGTIPKEPPNSPEFNFYCILRDYILVETENFANNSIELSRNFTIGPGCGRYLNKAIAIQNGQKPFRAINSIVKVCEPICRANWPMIFGDTFFTRLHADLESSRIIHSQVLNAADITGDLCLSIHPLDYLTMSDNGYNWESCMTWTRDGEPGEYRAGTLEMMNSPCVVVAYIQGKEPFSIDDRYEWTNKKWRELFIIDKNFISGIRGYPYQMSELEEIILHELAEMAKKANFSQFRTEVESTYNHSLYIRDKHYYSFYTGLMYNDYDCHTCHYIVAEEPSLFLYGNMSYLYSGVAYCLECGEPLSPSEDDPEDVLCLKCQGLRPCASCGSPIRGTEYEVDGEVLCGDCAATCGLCGEDCYADETEEVSIPAYDHILERNELTHYCACPSCMEKVTPYLKKWCDEKYLAKHNVPTYYSGYWNILLPSIPDEIYDSFAQWVPARKDLVDVRETS